MDIGTILFVWLWGSLIGFVCTLIISIECDTVAYMTNEWLERDNEYGATYVVRMGLFIALMPLIAVLAALVWWVVDLLPTAWDYLTTKK